MNKQDQSSSSRSSFGAPSESTSESITDSQTRSQPNRPSIWNRCVAWITDQLMVVILTWPLFLILYTSFEKDTLSGSFFLGLFFLFSLVYTLICSQKFQSSIGKKAFNSSLVDLQSGDHLSFKQSLIRLIAFWLFLACFGIGVVWMFFNSKRRGLHDYLAGTMVISN